MAVSSVNCEYGTVFCIEVGEFSSLYIYIYIFCLLPEIPDELMEYE